MEKCLCRSRCGPRSSATMTIALRVWLICLVMVQTAVAGNPDAKRLYDDLLSNYNKLVRPVVNTTDVLRVCIKLKLSQLIDVNLKNQIMTTNLWVEQSWYDYKLRWEPKEYGGVHMLHVPSDHIWRPDIVLYNNCEGLFDLIANLASLEGIPQALPKVDSDGMSNVKNVTSTMTNITEGLQNNIKSKLGTLLNESSEAIENLPEETGNGPFSIAIKGAKRVLEGVKVNVLEQLNNGTERINEAVTNLTRTATDAYNSAETKVKSAAHSTNEFILSRLRMLDPESEMGICFLNAKNEMTQTIEGANANVSQCISEFANQGKNATLDMENLIDESRKIIQKYVAVIKDCVANLTVDSTDNDKDEASICLVNNSAKVAGKEFSASIEIESRTSINLEILKNAENSIEKCAPHDFTDSLNIQKARDMAEACLSQNLSL